MRSGLTTPKSFSGSGLAFYVRSLPVCLHGSGPDTKPVGRVELCCRIDVVTTLLACGALNDSSGKPVKLSSFRADPGDGGPLCYERFYVGVGLDP